MMNLNSVAAMVCLAIGIVVVGWGVAGCGDSGSRSASSGSGEDREAPLSGRLTLTGSSTIAPLAGEIAKRFEALHDGVRIDVQTGGSSRGIADAHSGLADIGMSSRSLKPTELEGVVTYVVARDGVAVVVHAENRVSELSDEQVLGIYTGKITDWAEVGGSAGAITVINRAEGRSELELITKYFKIKPSDIKPTLVAGENQECVKLVAGNVNAVAYLSVGTAEYEVGRGTALKVLPFDGVPATTASVKAGTFPLGRPLVMITKEDTPVLVDAFIAYAMSPEVDDLIEEQSFVTPR